ncbi:MAG: NRDE family protein [Spirosomaceae bacterium]|jgi:hypothetical protein|nr:NRDE family protein [Spirosomataceae bacterium]
MCFVTYLPYQDGFVLTSNRDEHIGRPKAVPPRQYAIGEQSVFYPKDGLAGGTWIAASSEWTLCLLNGAFVKHQHRPPYRRSRGLVVLDFFAQNDAEKFIQDYDFGGIEPFTLIMVGTQALHQLRWDDAVLHHSPLDPTRAHAWSSVTLYADEVIREREAWFEKWQNVHSVFEGDDVVDFHKFGGKGDTDNDLIISRETGLKTVSITQVQHTSAHFLMTYLDRLNGHQYRYRIFETVEI